MGYDFLSRFMAIEDSSLNRIHQWIDTKDVATISAFRGRLSNIKNPDRTLMRSADDKSELSEGYEFTLQENRKRNALLKVALRRLGYGVTAIRGVYHEDGSMVDDGSEESFFVVNLKDDPNFKQHLFDLSEWFNQDSFVYKPKSSDEALLIGTNGSTDFITYGQEIPIGSFISDVVAENMSRVGGRGFAFGSREDVKRDEFPATWSRRKMGRIEKQGLSDKDVESIVVDSMRDSMDDRRKQSYIYTFAVRDGLLPRIKR